MRTLLSLIVLACCGCTSGFNQPASVDAQHQTFFDSLRGFCGQAFEGKITVDTPNLGTFNNQRLLMHVAKCTDKVIEIPFFVGQDASRTWIIRHHGNHLSLHHRHNHQDGSADTLTLYGGHAVSAGWTQVQSFPADTATQQLFVEQGIPQSVDNVWQLMLYPQTFTYRLVRPAREVRVDFDLTKPLQTDLTPW